jgi:hypothetical protein
VLSFDYPQPLARRQSDDRLPVTDLEDDESWLNDLPLETPADFERAALEIERRIRPEARAKVLAGMVRGLSRIGTSPLAEEGALARFFLETPPTEMEAFKSPKFQGEYFGRLRDWVLYGDSEDVRVLVKEIFGISPTARELRTFVSKTSREKLAADIEAHARRVGLPIPPRKGRGDGNGFSREEFARFRRAFHHFGPQLVDAFEQAESGDPNGLVESGFEVSIGLPSILLASPSPKQRFGRGTRSALLLPEDRRRCQFRGCNLSVTNRRRYCTEHRRLLSSERDRMKKRRSRDRARVRQSTRLAERPVRGP